MRENRTVTLQIRVTPTEKESMEYLARKALMTVSNYLYEQVKKEIDKDDRWLQD